MPPRLSIFLTFTLFSTLPVFAQTGAVNGRTSLFTPNGKPMTMQQASLTFQAPPKQRVFQIEDIIYVHIKEKRTYRNTADNQRKKKIETESKITAMTKFTGLFKWPTASIGSSLPEIGGKIDHKTQNQGRLTRDESVDFYIPCRITDVRDNGNLVIEGNKSFGIGEEGNITTVTGIVRPDTIGPGYRVESNEVAELMIREIPSGNVYDTVRRTWASRLVEQLKPF